MAIEKLKIENMSHLLNIMTSLELQDLPSHIWECSICKWPELGFFLCIPNWKNSSQITENNDYKIQNLEFKVLFLYLVNLNLNNCVGK